MSWPFVTGSGFIRRLPRACNQLLAGNWSLKLNRTILSPISKMIFPSNAVYNVISFLLFFNDRKDEFIDGRTTKSKSWSKG